MLTEDNISPETKEAINKLCDIILINGDVLDKNKRNQYIQDFINKDIKWSGDNYEIRHIVQMKIIQYIDNCPSVQLFQFATDSKFQCYRKEFKEYYYNYEFSQGKSITEVKYPKIFEDAFDFIQESIDSHTLFKNFSIKIMDDAVNRAKREAEDAAQNAANSANIAAKKAEKAANEAAEKAIKDVLESDKITEGISQKIDEQMNYVTRNVSETSVTILGIFSGIVLAVVGGLFYSSSVIDNIYHSNFYRVLCIAALAGFVFFNLIIIMFKYIEKIRNHSEPDENNSSNKTKITKLDFAVIVIDIIFVILVFVFAGIQHNYPSNTPPENTECVSVTETEYNFK